MRSREKGAVFLAGGNGMYYCFLVVGTDKCVDIGRDGGNGVLTGSGVSSI